MSMSLATLPTSPANYIQVCRYGRRWCISLVTPVYGAKPISTKLGSDLAKRQRSYAQHVRARTGLPLRLPQERAP
jgi:hypothetical protein